VNERRAHSRNLATAHRRKESDLVAGVKRRIPRCKFLIARSDERRTVLGEVWEARNVESEKLLDGRGLGDFERFLGKTDDVFQAPEEQHLHANRLGDGRHR
jgi:hypothetical protein